MSHPHQPITTQQIYKFCCRKTMYTQGEQQLSQAGAEDGHAQHSAAEDERQEETVVPLHARALSMHSPPRFSAAAF